MTEPNAAPAKAPLVRKITQDRIKRAEGAFTFYSIRPYPGTSREDLLAPDYWKHVAHSFQPDDEIRVVPEDQAWRAHLYVTHAQHGEMFVQILSFFDLAPMDPEKMQTEDYEVKFRGIKKWSVVRKKDNHIIKEDIPRREDAVLEMANHVRVMRR